jgi:hypothetical protein
MALFHRWPSYPDPVVGQGLFDYNYMKCDECYRQAFRDRNHKELPQAGSTFRGRNCDGCPSRIWAAQYREEEPGEVQQNGQQQQGGQVQSEYMVPSLGYSEQQFNGGSLIVMRPFANVCQ